MASGKVILGIHVGSEELCVSICRNNQCEVVFRAPACIAITETGEVIAGQRAKRYAMFHADVKCDWIDGMMTYEPLAVLDHVMHKGVIKKYDDLCVAFFKDIKDQLERELGEDVDQCVVSTHHDHLDHKEKLKRFMTEAGFKVIRMLTPSAVCAIAEKNRNPKVSCHTLLCIAAEGHSMTVSLIEFDENIGEAFYSKHFFRPGADRMNTQELIRETLDLVDNSFPEYVQKHKEAKIYVYGQNTDDVKKSLSVYASEGAAEIGGNLKGEYAQFLYLDVIERAYGIEIVKADKTVVLPLVWMVDAQATVPVFKSIECKPIYNKSNDKLRIYTDADRSKPMAEMLEFPFDEVFGKCIEAQNVVGISMDFDSNKNLNLKFSLGNGKSFEWRVSDAYPVRSRQMSEKLDFRANKIEVGMYGSIISIKKMSPEDLSSPAGKGLSMIEKQMEEFIHKYDLNEIRQSLSTENGTKAIIEEILTIVDNLEYGVRFIHKNTWNEIEIETVKIYHRLLNMLDEVLHVVPIEAEGMFFDSKIHDAMYCEKRSDAPKDLNIDELQRGYYWYGKVFRPAKVKVVE